MFHIKNNTAVGIALLVLLTSCSTATSKGESQIAKANTESVAPENGTSTPSNEAPATASETPAAVSATPAVNIDKSPPPTTTPNTPSVASPNKGKEKVAANAAHKARVIVEDTAEAIKQRSGPGDPIEGKEKSELCQGCHGIEGVSDEPTAPKLAGQYGVYISKQLRNFQSGTRTHQIMSDIAKTISDDDLADISAYFASRKKMSGNGTENKLGEELFLHGDMSRMMVACVNCHGVNGKGKTPTNPVFPVIGGQHKDYLRVQLLNFRAGDRSNSPGGVMNIITQRLTDAELEALADYVSEL